MTETYQTIEKRNIDQLVLEYLIHEGYEEGALAFAEELNLDLEPPSTWQQSISPTNDYNQMDTSYEVHQTTLQKDLQSVNKLSDLQFSNAILNYYTNFNAHHDNTKIGNKIQPPLSRNTRNIKLTSGYSTISQRQEIKRLILNGEITSAITKISRWFPIILDSNNLLHFKLLRLNLIEMIRDHKFSSHSEADEKEFLNEILTFVRYNLINKISNSHKLLKELEFTMSLLCFRFDPSVKDLEDQKELPQELRNFFNINLRNQVFRLVNKEILDMYEVKCLSDYNQGYENDEVLDDVKLKIEYGSETPSEGEDDGIYNSKSKPVVYTGPPYESFSFDDIANFKDDEFESDLEEMGEETRDWDQLVDLQSIQPAAETSSEVYKGERSLRKDTRVKNEDEVESLYGLALESKLEGLVKLFVLTERKLQSLKSISHHTFEIKESSSAL